MGHDRFVADPWTPGALAAVPDDGDVLLVGTGLTGVDVALTLDRPGRTLHLVSRRGRLTVAADEVVAVAPVRDRLEVRLRSGRVLRVAAVVNCTGPLGDVRRAGDPFLDHLLAAGVARPRPSGPAVATPAASRWSRNGSPARRTSPSGPVQLTTAATRRTRPDLRRTSSLSLIHI